MPHHSPHTATTLALKAFLVHCHQPHRDRLTGTNMPNIVKLVLKECKQWSNLVCDSNSHTPHLSKSTNSISVALKLKAIQIPQVVRGNPD